MKRFMKISAIIAICWSIFHLYTASFGALPAYVQRGIHVSFALSLAYSLFLISKNRPNNIWKVVDGITIITPLLIGVYLLYHSERLTSRNWFVDSFQPLDLWLGIIYILLVIEVSRRTVGKVITLLGVLFIIYGFVGPYNYGLLSHRGLDLNDTVDLLFLSPEGIFGVPVGVAADYVFYFILFGAFLNISGGGQLFNDIAFRLTRKAKGGPAKAAVISSGFMGSISGSAVANVASTGIFTIPLMKRAGYSKKDSAAIEAIASTGGQILPPIMGAAVFIMAEMVGIPYVEIILAALIPALLFYIALLFSIHIKASKENIDNLSEEMEEKQEKIWKRIHLLLPMVALIVFIFMGYSLQRAALWAILLILVVSFLRKKTLLSFTDIFTAMEDGAKQAIKVTIPCAIAGIIVGIIGFSGLGLSFTSLIVQWSFGNIVLGIVLVALGCIILGMGMPTTSAYIMAATLLAPALQEFGIEPLAAHMFVLYFAVLSMITPPIALAAYSAAGIAGAGTNETGIRAFVLSIPAFMIPLSFVLNPSILLMGNVSDIVWHAILTTIGIMALCAFIVGYLFANIGPIVRVMTFIAAILLLIPNLVSSLIGFALFVTVVCLQVMKRNKKMEKVNLLNDQHVSNR
ncbi:TRAP transporter permease [Alteribacillus sp. YIM 98480]|uniref:TRAP transporter permease n=1 Tax=Alteribacillus sp. YIM 98480 TaxID=2606599 RepID=UPI00131CCB62|nr:TRAP transporter permease [Alteribacillus sp. YIM 98480]